MRKVAIVGAAGVPVGKHAGRLEADLAIEALVAALADARMPKEEVEGMVATLPRPWCEQRFFSTHVATLLRMEPKYSTEVYAGGMTGGLAFRNGVLEVAAGNVETCVVFGACMDSPMTGPDFQQRYAGQIADRDFVEVFGPTLPAMYALDAQRYMHDYSATPEDFAEVAVKNRRHASKNPAAAFREPLTVEDVLKSRMVADPLRLLECPAFVDGAVALVLAAEGRARKHADTPVWVRGTGYAHSDWQVVSDRPVSLSAYPPVARAARRAFDQARLGPKDVDVAELYAPFSFTEFVISEELGFFPRGQGPRALREGQTTLGGKMPLCPSGGCLSRGHPALVTPLYNLWELVLQLRGEAGGRQVKGAEVGLSQSEHGKVDGATVEVLERED